MKFLSDILAKAGLTVDGVVTLNNTATGQTPSANDNSTKLATTAWVRTFVQPYNLPIASGTTLGGVKIGSGLTIDGTGIVSVAASGVGAIRALQQITATAGQTVFTVSGGYTPGLIDVFLNGVLLTPTAITATNGNSFTLADAAVLNDLLDVFVYNPIYNGFISSTDQVPEGIVNLYYTNTRARSAISLTVTGTSGASTYDSGTGVLNVPTYSLSGLGGVPTSRTITIDGVTFDLTANRTWTILPTGGAAGDILAKTSATNYAVAWIPNYTSQVQHYVKLGEAMTIGTAVYVSGTTGNAGTNMIVSKASNASEPTSSKTIGLLASSGAQNDIVFVVTEGLVSGIDTSTAIAGDPVWLGVNGQLIYGLLNKPNAPQHLVFIGVVTRVQQVNGEIFVKVQNGFELHELHNVSALNPADGDMIKYVASTGLWTKIAATTNNITEGTNLYYTDGRVSTYLTANGYATQTYVNTAVSNLVASAPSTLDTLNELAIALGNDPNFATTIATSIGTKVPQTRTLTINGTAYDLSADRSWSIASGVTSFNTRTGAITSATGDYTTAQVTESGNLYYTNTRSRAAISLTTIGTSGAATYDNITGIINIPQYQGGVTSFNTRTGSITLSSTDVTTALTFTPVTNARTLTINGIAYDLTADRSWTVGVNPSARAIETFTATASQTTFTVTGGYVVGLVDVFINGVRLTSADYTATNGSTIVLSTGTGVGNIVDIVKYTSAFIANNALRQTTYFTATVGQTTFTISYTPGLVDVFYNGSKLASTEYTALNGTSIVLSTAASLNDVIEVTAYTYSVGAYSGQAQLNGTGLVRMSGTTVSYDNATYATQSYVTTAVANLVNAAPSTLDTLNELAAALGNDANFATTVTNSIATKLPSSSVSGTTNYLAKFTGASTIGNSAITDDGTTVTLVSRALSGTSASFIGTAKVLEVKQSAVGSATYYVFDNTVEATGKKWRFGYTGAVADTGTFSLYNETDNVLNFVAKGGNLGLGVTPSAWGSNRTALQFGALGCVFSDNNVTSEIGANVFISTAPAYTYITSNFATRYTQINGQFQWHQAPSGTAGNAISFTQAMTLTASGRLLINTPTESTYQLDVNGTGRFTGNVVLSGSDSRFNGGDSVGRLILSNSNTTTYIGLYGATHPTFPYVMSFVVNSAAALTLASTGAATFSSKVGVGGAAATYSLTAYNSANGTTAAFGGTIYGLRIDNGGTYSSGRTTIFGVDNSFYGSYQPLSIEASTLALQAVTGGNVLIGTTTDSGYKLDVNGTGRFSSSVTATQYTATSTGGSGLRVYGGSGTNQWDIYLNSTNLRFSDNTGTGSVVFDRPISGTSATFSSSVTANATSTFSNASSLSAIFSNGGNPSNYNSIELRGGTAGTAVNWQISKDNSTGNAFELACSTTAGGTTYGSPVFKILNTGAATFSSSVTAGGSVDITGTGNVLTLRKSNNVPAAAWVGATYTSVLEGGDNFNFYTGGVGSRLYITSAGDIGFGTSGPATYVEINKLFPTGSTQETYLRLTASQGGAWFSRIGLQFRWNDFGNGAAFNLATIIASPTWNGTTTGGGDLVFNTKSYASPLSLEPTEKMRIYANGAVTKGAQPFAMGGLATNQSISNTTFTPLAFQTNQGFYGFNTNNCWNNSTYTFTAPVGGVYIVNVSLMTDCLGQLALFVNGVRKHSIPTPPFSGSITWGGSAMIPLSAGEALTLQGYGTSGTLTANIYHTFFSIYLLG